MGIGITSAGKETAQSGSSKTRRRGGENAMSWGQRFMMFRQGGHSAECHKIKAACLISFCLQGVSKKIFSVLYPVLRWPHATLIRQCFWLRKLSECGARSPLLPWEFHRRDNTCCVFFPYYFSGNASPKEHKPRPKEVSSTVSFFIKFAVRRFASHKRPSNSGVGRKLVGRWRGGGERGRGDGGLPPLPEKLTGEH